jgi:hypothetical protein
MVCMSKIAPCGDQNVYKCKNDAFLVRSNSRRAGKFLLMWQVGPRGMMS